MKKGVSICVFAGLLATAAAQSELPDQSAQELRQQVIELQTQMKQMQSRLDELEGAKAPAAAAQPAAPASSQASTTQASQPPLQGATSPQVGEATATYDEFGENASAAPRYDNVPLDPKYTGFFRLPGTQTILKIGGYFKTDFIYDLKPAGNPDAFVPSSIPVPQVTTINNNAVSVRPTRLSLDFRIPKTEIGEVRFYTEGDFFGTNATTPRLRHAYAQAANLLIGQTFSNFMDPDGFPDTLDFQGPNGIVTLRNPQFRYTFALTPSTTFSISVEKPSSDVIFQTPTFKSQPNAPSPDGALRLRKEFEHGHFQVAALLRSIAAFVVPGTTAVTDSVFGWGFNVSTGFETIGKDNMILAVAAGRGISRYINDTSGLGIDAEVDTDGHLRATPNVGVVASYQHYWSKTLRSSVVYSYAAVQNTPVEVRDTYNHGEYTAGNLIWNPFGSSLNVGAEFLYGWQVLKDGSKGNAPRIQFSTKYTFVKVGAEKK